MHKLIYDKSAWRNDNYHFDCDVSSTITDSSVIKGWFVNKTDVNYHVQLVDQKNNVVEGMQYLKNRPKLSKLFPDIAKVNLSGFEIDIQGLSPNLNYSFAIFQGNKRVTKLLSLVSQQPLLYVHIAKTAGSTVNKVLMECFGAKNSLVHVESNSDWKQRVKDKNIDFLSGHIPYAAFLKQSELTCYKKAITFREPYAHVISHLSWIRALALPENKKKYDAPPEYIQLLSAKLASFDLSSPEQITAFIQSFTPVEFKLLDNTQTRYIRTNLNKERVDDLDVKQALQNLSNFEFVGTDADIGGLLSRIAADYGFECKTEDRRENVLNNKFGLDINNQKVNDALLPLVKFDLKLYAAVQGLEQ